MEWYFHIIFIVLIIAFSIVFYLAWFRDWGERWARNFRGIFPMRPSVKKFLEFYYKIGITFMLIDVILIYILVLTGVWNY